MPSRPSLRTARGQLSVLALSLLTFGCGFDAVRVEQYEPEPGSSHVCAELIGRLPDTVDDAVRRDVEPAGQDDLVAAWGQPAIVLRCGVPMPASYRPDVQLYDIDGVGWLPDEGEGGTFFTATDRAVLVEVAVPDDYAPEASALADLAPAILAAVPARTLP